MSVTSTKTELVLQCSGLAPRYGHLEVAHDIELTVRKGELLALLGPNGAGKTSTMELIAGRVSGSGSIVLNGERLDGLPAHKRAVRGLALVPENRGLFGDLTVSENLALGTLVRRQGTSDFDQVFDLFPVLKDRINQTAATMSGGEQQMLAIGRAILAEPDLMIVDEPTQGLAPVILDQISDALEQLKRSGLSILLVEQSVGFAARTADVYSVMSGGKIVVDRGDKSDLDNAEGLFEKYLGD